jgi:hypothetical protein
MIADGGQGVAQQEQNKYKQYERSKIHLMVVIL